MNTGEGPRFQNLVSVIAVCGFALFAVLTAPLWSGAAQNWLGPIKNWLPEAPSAEQGGNQAPQAPAAAWTDKQIETALMQCVQILAPVNADLATLEPIREGDCGTPAPVLLKSIGDKDKVAFDPPLILDCAMVVGLEHWLRETVQPAALEAFSSPVSKVIGSSYACRNVYNQAGGHLSQHAFANAVDLPMFVLADGKMIDVTHGWGPTQRDLVAAAKAKKVTTGDAGVVGNPAAGKKPSATSDVVRITTASMPSARASIKTPPLQSIPKLLPKASFYGSRMTGAARNSRRCSARRPMTSIGLTCIWTFKTERNRSANRPIYKLALRGLPRSA